MKRIKRRKLLAAICLAIPFVSTNCLDNTIANAQQGCSELAGSACNNSCDIPLGYGSSSSGGSSCDEFGAARGTPPLASFGTMPGQWNLFSQDRVVKVHGWANAGFMGNTSGPSSRFHGPYNAVDRSNEPMFNQGYLIAETALPSNGGPGIGARIDTLYGEDYFLAQSFGVEKHPNGDPRWNGREYYGMAIPQAFAEVGSQQLSLKAGHFYSPIGYEGVMAPDNFFYSKAYSYQFAGPFTHWGALTTWRPSAGSQFQVGLTNGWNALDRPTNRLGILAGYKFTADQWWASFAITTGDEDNNVAALPGITPGYANRTRYSCLAGVNLTESQQYVAHYWQGFQADGVAGGGNADWWGVDQYFYRQINCRLRQAIRVEWFKDQDGTRIGLNRPSNPNKAPFIGNAYSLAYGLNYAPSSNLIFRPEIRADWFDRKAGGALPFDDGAQSSQLAMGGDFILKF
jgi:hypothetical protein